MVTAGRSDNGSIALNLSGRKINITDLEAQALVYELLRVDKGFHERNKESNEVMTKREAADPFDIEPERKPTDFTPSPTGPQSGLPEFDDLVAKPTSGMDEAKNRLAEDIF
jgi:hypothetical protein